MLFGHRLGLLEQAGGKLSPFVDTRDGHQFAARPARESARVAILVRRAPRSQHWSST
jgi:hypothetical protein